MGFGWRDRKCVGGYGTDRAATGAAATSANAGIAHRASAFSTISQEGRRAHVHSPVATRRKAAPAPTTVEAAIENATGQISARSSVADFGTGEETSLIRIDVNTRRHLGIHLRRKTRDGR